jgi:hypothetical protein
MTRKELEEQVTGILMPVASPEWLVERVCDSNVGACRSSGIGSTKAKLKNKS